MATFDAALPQRKFVHLPEDYDWSDVVPIPQHDGPDPVVTIAYTEEFVELMSVFRALSFQKEYSERGLELTQCLLDINPASYTVWQYRRDCLRALNADLSEELDFMDEFASENPKNYQIWHHRRAIVEMMGDGSRELKFTQEVFEEDAKNYHAWAHRQWVIKAFLLWDNELAFVESFIEKDIRNNSAWNQRWFVVHLNPLNPPNANALTREIEFSFAAIDKVKKNESAWNYLRGLVFKYNETVQPVLERILALIQTDAYHNNYFAVGLAADICDLKYSNDVEKLTSAVRLFKQLVAFDPIRAKSWIRRVHQTEGKLINILKISPDEV